MIRQSSTTCLQVCLVQMKVRLWLCIITSMSQTSKHLLCTDYTSYTMQSAVVKYTSLHTDWYMYTYLVELYCHYQISVVFGDQDKSAQWYEKSPLVSLHHQHQARREGRRLRARKKHSSWEITSSVIIISRSMLAWIKCPSWFRLTVPLIPIRQCSWREEKRRR